MPHSTSNNVRSAVTAACFAAVCAGTPPVQAEAESPHEFSGNVALSTEYVFRGISQSNEDPAISGGFDYSYTPFGFYAGVWASNIEFNIDDTGRDPDDASIEIDYYAGFSGEFPFGVGWDVGGLYYHYPGNDEEDLSGEYDYWEAYGSLSYTFSAPWEPSITGGFNWSPDYFGEDDDAIYGYGELALSLPLNFGLSFYVGHLDVEGDQTFPAGYSYTHWSVGGSYEIGGFSFDLSYFDADDDCSDELGIDDDLCEGVLFSVSRSM